MSKRNKYISAQVDEDTWQAVIDAGNLWGDSVSMAAYKLLQRGITSLDAELGSKTPAHIKVSRISQSLNTRMNTRQKITESYRLAKEFNDEETVLEIEKLAAELKVEL